MVIYFRGAYLAVSAAILVTWGVVFSLCVLLWYVNRLLNTEKAEWRLLFFSLACVVVPRSVLPFGFVDFTMLQMCLVGIAFFNGRRSCMTHVFCGTLSCMQSSLCGCSTSRLYLQTRELQTALIFGQCSAVVSRLCLHQ